MIDKVLNTYLYGKQGMIIPISIKTSDLEGRINFTNSTINVGSFDVKSEVLLQLNNQALVTNSSSLLSKKLNKIGTKTDIAAAIIVGKAVSYVSFSSSSITTNSKDLKITSKSTNNLSSSSQIAANVGNNQGASAESATAPTGERNGISISVVKGETDSGVSQDSGSTFNSKGSIEITTSSLPSGSAAAKTSIFVNGKAALMTAANQDDSSAIITIDGKLTSGSTSPVSDASPTLANYVTSWNYLVGANGSVTSANGTQANTTVNLRNRDIIKFNNYSGNLYGFLGTDNTSINLSTVNPLTNSSFAELATVSFQNNSSLKVGDSVSVKNLGVAYTYKLSSNILLNASGSKVATVNQLSDGSHQFQSVNGASGFTFNNLDVVLWDDDRTYQYLSSQPQTITSYQLFPFSPSDGWAIQPLLQDGSTKEITAILADPNNTGVSNYILADAQPQNISAALATGNEHNLYMSAAYQFDGSSSNAVDVVNHEILISVDEIDFYNRLAEGQIVNYSVLDDAEARQDSSAIGGVDAGIDYFIAKKGIDAQGRGRISLAPTPADVIANRWISFSDLGVGAKHMLSAELGKTSSLSLTGISGLTQAAT